MTPKVEPFSFLRSSIPRAALGQYGHQILVKYSPTTTFLPEAYNAGTMIRKANNAAIGNRGRMRPSSLWGADFKLMYFNL